MIYVDILHLNSDLDEAKLKEKAQLFHDSFLTKVLATHSIRQTLHFLDDTIFLIHIIFHD